MTHGTSRPSPEGSQIVVTALPVQAVQLTPGCSFAVLGCEAPTEALTRHFASAEPGKALLVTIGLEGGRYIGSKPFTKQLMLTECSAGEDGSGVFDGLTPNGDTLEFIRLTLTASGTGTLHVRERS